MSIPGQEKMVQPLLKYLVEVNEVVELATIREEMARIFHVTEDEQQERLNNGQKRFVTRVRWVAHGMRSAGLLQSPQRGCFKVTQEGRDEFEKGTELSLKYLKQRYEQLKQQRQGTLPSEAGDAPIKSQQAEGTTQWKEQLGLEASDERNDLSPDEKIENALGQINEKFAVDILDRAHAIGATRFEDLCVNLLIKMRLGIDGKRIGGPGDGGIDGIINEDKLGLRQIGIQAKCNAEDNNVGSGDISRFSGALDMRGLQKGVFVTTSSFTSAAKKAVEKLNTQNKRITLIDGNHLTKLMIEHHVGCKEKTLIMNTPDESFWQLGEE